MSGSSSPQRSLVRLRATLVIHNVKLKCSCRQSCAELFAAVSNEKSFQSAVRIELRVAVESSNGRLGLFLGVVRWGVLHALDELTFDGSVF